MVTRRINLNAAAQRGQAQRQAAAPAPAPARRGSAGTTTQSQRITRHTQVSLREARNSQPLNEGHENEVLGTNSVQVNRLARIRYGVGLTLNLGNFESARIDVQVEIPCDVDEIDNAYEQAVAFACERLNEEEARWAQPR
jgi:hypothetical protein